MSYFLRYSVVILCLLGFLQSLQAQFSDEFDGSALGPAWNYFETSFFAETVSGGSLTMNLDDAACHGMGMDCVWFNNDTGPMLYQTVTGDFTATTAVQTRSEQNPSLPVSNDTQLAGLIVRDPASTSGDEDYIFNVVGVRFDLDTVETKSTLNSNSTVVPFNWPSTDAELRICREGATFNLYARAIGATTWNLLQTFNRPDLPNTLQVGLITYAFLAYPEDIVADFDYIRVEAHTAGDDCTADGSTVPQPEVDIGDAVIPQGSCSEYLPTEGSGMTYLVGEGMPYPNISDVPMESLQAGDVVKIHYRATPYKEKILVGGQGTEANPIIIMGVPNENCEYPVIDGASATTRANLNFPNQDKGVITVEGNQKPQWIYIANLEVQGGHPSNTFTDSNGQTLSYQNNAAGINVIRGEYIHILGCNIHNNGNGLFVASYTAPSCENSWCADESFISKNILVEGCSIYDNAFVGSNLEHNVYTEALGIVFQYNYIGNVISGANGMCLKDRSAGSIIRYNWIEGIRPLDLVEPEYGEEVLYDSPLYDLTPVYGNILVKLPGVGNDRIVHYGGDNGDTTRYRKGTLHFYHNTVIAKRNDSVVFGLETNDEVVEARNNIFYADAGSYPQFHLIDGQGTANLYNNWMSATTQDSQGGGGTVTHTNTTTGADPGFTDASNDLYTLTNVAPALGLAGALDNAVATLYPVEREYVPHVASIARTATSQVGAYETTTISGGNPTGNMPVIIFSDTADFTFGGGHATQMSSIASGEGLGGSNAIKYSNIQTNNFTRLDGLNFASPLDLTDLTAADYLMLSIDIGDVPAPLNGVFIHFNDWPWNSPPNLQLPEIDSTAGYQTFILPISSIHSALGNQLSLVNLSQGSWPVATVWLDEIKLVRTQDMHPLDVQRLVALGTDVNASNAQLLDDYDGDGINNMAEIIQGSDLDDALSMPVAHEISGQSNTVTFTFQLAGALDGVKTSVQASQNLTGWESIATRNESDSWVPDAGVTLQETSPGMWSVQADITQIAPHNRLFRILIETINN